MAIGLFIGYYFQQVWAAFAYMGLLGATMGLAGTIKSALWAEFFGRDMIGTVRSLFSSIMVLSTAVSPFLLGWLLDGGMTMSSIFYIAFISTILAGLLSVKVLFQKPGLSEA